MVAPGLDAGLPGLPQSVAANPLRTMLMPKVESHEERQVYGS